MEILLFCIEVAQYQKYVKPRLSKLDEIKYSNEAEIEYQNVLISEILESQDKDVLFIDNVKMKANQLFTKYIEAGTTFEINISGTMRDSLTDTIGNLDQLLEDESVDLSQMYTVFEQSVQEMMTLQSISFERFKQSETFCDVKALLVTE